MRNSFMRVAAVGVVAGLLTAALPVTMAQAAAEPSFPAGSDGPVYLLSGDDYITLPAGSDQPWNPGSPSILSPVPLSATPEVFDEMYFALPLGAYAYTPFLSAPGQERTVSAWKAYSDTVILSTLDNHLLAPAVSPGAYILGEPGQAAVRAAGGTYSLGIAIRDQLGSVPGNTVLAAYYTTINVDPGTGNFKFATPAAPAEKDDTTTSVAASDNSIHAGESITLTATVAPSDATGNVQFLAGSTSLGTAAVSAGQAVLTTTDLPVGSNSITAVYSGDDDYNGSTSSAITVAATALTGIDSEDLPTTSPNAITVSQQGFSVTVSGLGAYNGQKVNVWGYSAPTLLGQATVSGDSVTVPTGSLPSGQHTIAVTLNSDDSLIGFTTVTLVLSQGEGSPAGIDLNATVRTSVDGAFQLIVPANAEATIDNPQLIEDTPGHFTSLSTGELGQVRVVDDRIITHRGWTLTSDVAPFTSAGKPDIANTALGLDPILVDSLTADEYGDTAAPAALDTPVEGAAQTAGSAVYTSTFAELGAGKFNPRADFNADLAFKAPAGSPAGIYNSTLTLTLVSK